MFILSCIGAADGVALGDVNIDTSDGVCELFVVSSDMSNTSGFLPYMVFWNVLGYLGLRYFV